VHRYTAQYAASFPGDAATGMLDEAREEDFADFADDAPCPALDPGTGLCDLYAARPLTCRTFGPAVRATEDGAVGACELCYDGASDEEIAASAIVLDTDALEAPLLSETGRTIVAFALR
jgi:Fe-S-cluster containining protein